jgi:shikimate kinase
MNLFLIEYRCTGKTTVGKSVAATIDWSFADADNMLVEKYGKQIKDIVETEGWEAFRRKESSMLKQICNRKRQVVATGGGAVLDADNVRDIQASGIIVGLGATAETVRERMLQDINTANFRPALTSKGLIEEVNDHPPSGWLGFYRQRRQKTGARSAPIVAGGTGCEAPGLESPINHRCRSGPKPA